jgi:hypothetical protein
MTADADQPLLRGQGVLVEQTVSRAAPGSDSVPENRNQKASSAFRRMRCPAAIHYAAEPCARGKLDQAILADLAVEIAAMPATGRPGRSPGRPAPGQPEADESAFISIEIPRFCGQNT